MSEVCFSGCGIVGMQFFNTNVLPANIQSVFNQMLESIKHRGPDGSGIFSKDNILLGHRRLSIIDVSDAGNQPMTRGNLTITFNGEIYNYQEIRDILETKGYHFTSNTDTEVILISYQHWGVKALEYFNGMFAFAIWDEKDKYLFIARDRLGKKPLYYYKDKNAFIFGSEIQSLLLSGLIKPEVDFESFEHRLFATSFLEINSERTLINHIQSLPPGFYMKIFANGRTEKTKYWEIPFQKSITEKTIPEITEQLETLLNDSIKLRLVSDVPVSGFLSGGIDSSLINHFASIQTNDKLTCITVQYEDGGKDLFSGLDDLDLMYSKEFVECNTNKIIHKIVTIKNEDITLDLIDKITDLSSLADDDRLLSIYKNYQSVKDLGFKVVLNGQGADEIMGGYVGLKYFYETMFDIKNPDKEIITRMFPSRTIVKLNILNKDCIQKANQVYNNVYDFYNSLEGSPVEKIHRFLIPTQLSRILCFEDYLSMQHGIECRLPFLDYRIVEFSFSIPYLMHFIQETRTGKKLLRDIAAKYLPQSISNRPKQAFPSSHSPEKHQQLLSIFQYHRTEIVKCDIINRYFDENLLLRNQQNLSIHELWHILAIWRWKNALNCAIK